MPDINGSLDGKVAFVTGAASGIGRTPRWRSPAGAPTWSSPTSTNLPTRRPPGGRGAGRAGPGGPCDVTRSDDVQAALDQIVERFGHLDYAFNNAGIEQQHKPFAEITEDEWDRIININLRSVFVCMKYEIPLMLQHGGGAIVNTSSGAGVKGFGRGAAYAAADARDDRPHQVRGPGLRRREYSDQRHLPRHHRHPDDAPIHRRHPRRPRQSHCARTHRTHGPARRNRRRRRLAVLRRSLLRHRTRPCRRRRPNALAMQGLS